MVIEKLRGERETIIELHEQMAGNEAKLREQKVLRGACNGRVVMGMCGPHRAQGGTPHLPAPPALAFALYHGHIRAVLWG